MNRSSDRFLFFPSRRDQLFYFITFCRFCQVNNLWTDVQPIILFSSPTACPKQSAYSFYHTFTLLSSELFLNKFHRPLSISRSALPLSFIHLSSWLPLPCDSFIIIPRSLDFVKHKFMNIKIWILYKMYNIQISSSYCLPVCTCPVSVILCFLRLLLR